MLTSDLDYPLPQHAIATRPAEPRDHSRLMVVQRLHNQWHIHHRRFFDLPEFLRPSDLLITNNTRVLPAKLLLHRQSGGNVQALFVRELPPSHGLWEMLVRTRGKVRPGETLLAANHHFTLQKRLNEGLWQVQISPPTPAQELLPKIGTMPIPPYIEKARKTESTLDPASPIENRKSKIENPHDDLWYQTTFAAPTGNSVAAPTAGLHFTPQLLATLQTKGIHHAHVELDVGPGTFLPVETETLEQHAMHAEHFRIPAATILALRQARQKDHRIIVTGTTAVRTLESAADQILSPALNEPPQEISANTKLKILPPYPFQLTDALLTNFHLPKSTLMALVAAFLDQPSITTKPAVFSGAGQSTLEFGTGLSILKSLYALAIQNNYRFYSYGDAMLILPN